MQTGLFFPFHMLVCGVIWCNSEYFRAHDLN